MARINSIDYAKFGNENFLSFCREFVTITGTYPIIGQRFGYLTTAYAAAVEELDEAMKKQTWSDLTEPIRKADEARDKVLISVKAMIEAMRHYSPIEGVTTDAERVYRFVKLNTLNPAAQYDKETAQISNFLQDMERYCQAEVERMGLQTALAELKRLNDDVAEKIAQRDIEDSLKKAEAVKTARRNLDTLYVALKDTVNGASVVDADGLLTPYIDAVNQMLKRQETQVLKTPTTKPDTPSGGTPPGETTPPTDTDPDNTPDNTDPDNGNTGGDNDNTGTLTPDPDAPGQNPNPTPGEGNGENEDEYTPPDNDGGFGKAK